MATTGRAARALRPVAAACATCAAATTLVVGAATAWAGFSASVTASTPVTTGSVAPPTSVTAVATCKGQTGNSKASGGGGGSFVTVGWAPSASAFVTTYNILRSAGGAPATLVAAGVSRTTWADTSIVGMTTYDYTVQAVYRGWTANSAAPGTTTTTRACG